MPTPKRPANPLAVSSVHRLLTNPYYKGDVTYRGVNYKGAHDPLVPAEVWYQVQSVLTSHKSAAEATQIHDHYLKGSIYCGACGSRLMVSNAKNRHGFVYPYFVCSGRHSKRTDCTRSAILIEDVEHLIEDYYTRIQITPARREALAGMLHHEFDQLMSAETDELTQLTANRDRLENEQTRLIQAHYADAIPLSLLKREQDRILTELDHITHRIDAHHGEYTEARAHLDDALNLLENCVDIYKRCDDANRRLCNQAFFTKIYIDEDDDLHVEYARPYEMLLDPEINDNALTWAANADKARTQPNDSSGKGSSLVRGVDQGGLQSHEWKRVERLEAVWELARRGLGSSGGVADSGLAGAATEPKRRSRTPLTANQIDAIQTARDNGESVMSIARRFDASRMTVWEKTRSSRSKTDN